MILHVTEESPFLEHVLDVFEAVAPGGNLFIIKKTTDLNGSHPHSTSKAVKVFVFDNDQEIVNHILGRSDYHAIIFHNLFSRYKHDLVLRAPAGVRLHWMCWGGDFYKLPRLSRKLYLPLTAALLGDEFSFWRKLDNFLYDRLPRFAFGINRFRSGVEDPRRVLQKSLKKLESVSTVLPSEFDLVRGYVSPRATFKTFKYASIEGIVKGFEQDICVEGNFIIGNSASYTNNHLDAFELVRSVDTGDKKIFCPLSYGNNSYAVKVADYGARYFGDRFIALHSFLPASDYNSLLRNSGNMIMLHLRQQAIGNILMGLWKGARIFFSRDSPVYAYLRELGLTVYLTTDLSDYKNMPGHYELAMRNRPILIEIYGYQTVVRETGELVRFLDAKR